MAYIGSQLKRAQIESFADSLPEVEAKLQGRVLYSIAQQRFYIQTNDGYAPVLLNDGRLVVGRQDAEVDNVRLASISPSVLSILQNNQDGGFAQIDGRVRNVTGDPNNLLDIEPGNPGRILFDTRAGKFYGDNGLRFELLGSSAGGVPGGGTNTGTIDLTDIREGIRTNRANIQTNASNITALQNEFQRTASAIGSRTNRVELSNNARVELDDLVLDEVRNSGYQVDYNYVMSTDDDTVVENGTAYFSYVNGVWEVSVIGSSFDKEIDDDNKISVFTVNSNEGPGKGQVYLQVGELTGANFTGFISWGVAATFPIAAGSGRVRLTSANVTQRVTGFTLDDSLSSGYQLSYQILVASQSGTSDKVVSGKVFISRISGVWFASSLASSLDGGVLPHRFSIVEDPNTLEFYLGVRVQSGVIGSTDTATLNFRLDTIFGV